MAKKSFASGIAARLEQEKANQASELDKRFDTASSTLSERPSLMHPVSRLSPVERDAEQLASEGKGELEDVTLPLDVLDDNPLNSRTLYDEEQVKARAASIAAHGQLMRALVTPNPTQPGRYILIDGQYRKRAKHHLNHSTMDCRVITGLSKVDFYKLSRAANAEREQESILDIALGYRKLLDQGLASTDEELAAIVGESRPKVNKMLAIVDLPQAVLDAIAQKPTAFGVSIGYELTLHNKVAGTDKTVALVERIIEEELPVTKVVAIRTKAEDGIKAKRNTSRQYKIMRDGQVVGMLKEWDSGRVTVDMTFDDPAKREAYIANMKHQLELDDPT